ncbi:hypothetical protein EFE23_20785 [Micromonospora solifontis]|uniref:Transposase n=1 Tax=Micromonospora solifontis TaxID=2487138 RepID=A0ABX9WBJ9_9ACTN|nr:hypothetical protein EFE23_20785 [Micromonospora solifontis]
MPAPKKYPDDLRERATRLVVEARRDPASAVGAIRRIADQLGVHDYSDCGPQGEPAVAYIGEDRVPRWVGRVVRRVHRRSRPVRDL